MLAIHRQPDHDDQGTLPPMRRAERGRRIAEYLVPAHPVPGVLKACTELRAELVVIGRHGGPHWQERLLGSVAQNLVQQLKADTLLFP